MLGRTRPSSSSPECLELERSPPKVVKHDSLSIYEATLVKLRQGSQRDLVSSPEIIEMDANYNSASNFTDEEVMATDSKVQASKTISIIHLFARYSRSSQRALNSRHEAVMIEDSSSACSSPSPGTG